MRAISLVFSLLLWTTSALATDEFWGIYQFRQNLKGSHFLFTEYVRRDTAGLFEEKKLDLLRLSYGGKWQSWTYLVGGAYVDFATSADERRLHQFFMKNHNLNDSISSSIRLGLEQRSFIADDNLYLRARLRAQLNLPFISFIGFSIYDELFYALNGENRFYQGFNENRLGLGLRLKSDIFELLLYQTFANVKTLKYETEAQWLQLQTVFTF